MRILILGSGYRTLGITSLADDMKTALQLSYKNAKMSIYQGNNIKKI